MKVHKQEISNYLVTFIFVMLSFGYVISSFMPVYFNLPSRPFNVSFRALYLGISLYLILKGYKKITQRGMPRLFWAFLIFLILYSIRIMYDSLVLGIVFKSSLFFLFSFSFGGTFIPFVAIAMYSKELNYKNVISASYFILAISSLLILVLIFKLYGSINISFLSSRFSFLSDDGKAETINAITLSMYGMLLSNMSIYFLLFRKSCRLIIVGSTLILGLLLLLLGASRGPQITFALGLLFQLSVYVFVYKKSLVTKARFGIAVAGLFVFLSFLISKIDLESITMYNRFANFGKDASSDTSLREASWIRAWDDFLNNPFLGRSYMDLYNMSYTHNVYLESLMAMGMVGLFFFIFPYLTMAIKKITNVDQVFIYLLFVLTSFTAFFSGSLFINPYLWSTLGLMIGFNSIRSRRLNSKKVGGDFNRYQKT
ncbi:O-antigen ligase family protein [Saprospiraceae bacterium]|nr:O-antigen ligase family protein [Saprospiraceae bacterium]